MSVAAAFRVYPASNAEVNNLDEAGKTSESLLEITETQLTSITDAERLLGQWSYMGSAVILGSTVLPVTKTFAIKMSEQGDLVFSEDRISAVLTPSGDGWFECNTGKGKFRIQTPSKSKVVFSFNGSNGIQKSKATRISENFMVGKWQYKHGGEDIEFHIGLVEDGVLRYTEGDRHGVVWNAPDEGPGRGWYKANLDDGSFMKMRVFEEWVLIKQHKLSVGEKYTKTHTSYKVIANGAEPKAWKVKVLKDNARAKAFVSKALQKLAAGRVPHIMDNWFGSHSKSTEKEVRRVLDGTAKLFENVDYMYPGLNCDDDMTLAYISQFDFMAQNPKGEYVIHLCPKALTHTSKEFGELLEVLVHEGSHHKPMGTKDVCKSGLGKQPDCEKAYGRSLARELLSRGWEVATSNADNIQFFTVDAATAPSQWSPLISYKYDPTPAECNTEWGATTYFQTHRKGYETFKLKWDDTPSADECAWCEWMGKGTLMNKLAGKGGACSDGRTKAYSEDERKLCCKIVVKRP